MASGRRPEGGEMEKTGKYRDVGYNGKRSKEEEQQQNYFTLIMSVGWPTCQVVWFGPQFGSVSAWTNTKENHMLLFLAQLLHILTSRYMCYQLYFRPRFCDSSTSTLHSL